ncbi:MAG: PHB depolymerase family esterase [Bacteroidia bacterium]|nr:PHB depolymerase family esterase [Bacteroidia bacterium]
MFYYEPANIDKTKAQPMVVVLHGCLQCASSVAAQTGWNKLADEQGFYVLYPQQRFFNNPEKCFKWYKRKHTNKNRGENYSIKKMVDYMQSHNRIDSSKVFITGLSAGAAMSVIMMADYPETFNAGAIFAGGAYKSGNGYVSAMMALLGWRVKSAEKWGNIVRKQNPGFNGNYPRMIIYQGNSDWVVNKRNGTELLKQWSNLHHIGTQPTETINQYVNVKDIQRNSYATNNHKEAIVFYRVNKLSHALLVDPGKCKYQGGKRGFFSKDKNYNSTLFTAYDFGLIKRPSINGPQTLKREEKNVQFTVAPENTTSTLLWSFPSDCKVIKNDNSNTLILDWGNNPGNINVSELDSQNCIKQYHTLSVRVE